MTELDEQASVVVGIATHNRADMLRKAIRSAYDQSHRPLRVSVADDASTDETPCVRDEFAGISWERCDPAQGYLRSRNRIMLSASERYYVSLDDDAWFLKGDEVAIAVDLLESRRGVAAVAFDIVSPDQPRLNGRGSKASVNLFIGCGHVLRLSVVKEMDGYCEFPGAYGAEEKDLCLRLIDAGYEIVKLDGVHVWHDKTTTARDLARQHTSGVCNDLTLTVRRAPLSVLLPLMCYKLVSHIAFAVRRGLVGPCMRGIREFAGATMDTWRSREPVRLSSFARYHSLAKSPREVGG